MTVPLPPPALPTGLLTAVGLVASSPLGPNRLALPSPSRVGRALPRQRFSAPRRTALRKMAARYCCRLESPAFTADGAPLSEGLRGVLRLTAPAPSARPSSGFGHARPSASALTSRRGTQIPAGDDLPSLLQLRHLRRSDPRRWDFQVNALGVLQDGTYTADKELRICRSSTVWDTHRGRVTSEGTGSAVLRLAFPLRSLRFPGSAQERVRRDDLRESRGPPSPQLQPVFGEGARQDEPGGAPRGHRDAAHAATSRSPPYASAAAAAPLERPMSRGRTRPFRRAPGRRGREGCRSRNSGHEPRPHREPDFSQVESGRTAEITVNQRFWGFLYRAADATAGNQRSVARRHSAALRGSLRSRRSAPVSEPRRLDRDRGRSSCVTARTELPDRRSACQSARRGAA